MRPIYLHPLSSPEAETKTALAPSGVRQLRSQPRPCPLNGLLFGSQEALRLTNLSTFDAHRPNADVRTYMLDHAGSDWIASAMASLRLFLCFVRDVRSSLRVRTAKIPVSCVGNKPLGETVIIRRDERGRR